MNSKIQSHHQQKLACVYLRQSSMAQVLHNQESTNRQYALQNQALQYGWPLTHIRIMDGDLGRSGAQTTNREDFKSLVAEVSMGNVGAIFVLEASRLSRSSADWNRLLELCSLTQTLIIDQDGCYDPSQFNDQLLLGLKGTMSQAELHLIRGRLHGAKLNKAKRGELRFPLPAGYLHDEDGNITFDPDAQVRNCINLVFSLFKEKGSAYAVTLYFTKNNILFPKRAFGGRWKGVLKWDRLTHKHALDILRHPFYAGAYSFGRHKSTKMINPAGEIITRVAPRPIDEWPVLLKDHHPAYIAFDDYERNACQLQANAAPGVGDPISGPPREGQTLLQGLLICGACGHRMSIRYKSGKRTKATYACDWQKRQGYDCPACFTIHAGIVDPVIEKKIIAALTPANVAIAVGALDELEKRHGSLDKHWQMNIQRCQYEADLAERRFEKVDPANRLVAASLETQWNKALEKLSLAGIEYQQYQAKQGVAITASKKIELTALAREIPKLWARSKNVKDKKRIIRLLISDITVTKDQQTRALTLKIRWQTGALQQITVAPPPTFADTIRCPQQTVDLVRSLTLEYGDDRKTIAILNERDIKSPVGKVFNKRMIKHIKHKFHIKIPDLKTADEFTSTEVCAMFHVSRDMVHYWIRNGYVPFRKTHANIYLVTITPAIKLELVARLEQSYKKEAMARVPLTS